MTRLKAIFLRELDSFRHSAVSPVVLSVFLVLSGFFFTQVLFAYSELSLAATRAGGAATVALTISDGVFHPLSSNMSLFLMFLLPAVSMRIFSEEYRSGRYGLVMTYPVAEHVWVLGKFGAVLAVGIAMLILSWAFYGVAAVLGNPEPGPFFAVQIGLLLVAGMVAAWGTFFSSLVPYQVVCYILSFAFVLVLYTVGSLEPFLPGALGRLATMLSLPEHFIRFSRGLVDSRDIVYFLAWTAMGLAAATASLSGRRLAGARRLARWTPLLALAGITIVAGFLAERRPLTADWTSNSRYSLSPQTVQVLRSLDQDVEVRAYFQRMDPNRKTAEVLLSSFRDNNTHLRYSFFDPDRDVGQVRRDGVTTVRSVVIESGDRRRQLLDPDESTLVNAVYRVVLGDQPVVYYLLGHGEPSLDGEGRDGFLACDAALAEQGYIVRPLLLADAPQVPGDAALVMIVRPVRDFRPAEIEAIDTYLARGGSVLTLLDPGSPASINEWTSRYNVGLGDDILVSRSGAAQSFGVDDRVIILFSYGPHGVTKGLDGLATFFPFAQSLRPIHSAMRGLTAKTVLMTDNRSWAETDLESVAAGEMSFTEGEDFPGPIPFGVALEIDRAEFYGQGEGSVRAGFQQDKTVDDPVLQSMQKVQDSRQGQPQSIFDINRRSRLIIVGDAGFAANEHINLYGNRDLLLNMVSWLAREQILIAQRARADVSELLVLGPAKRRLIGWGCSLGWPLLVGAVGTMVVLRRRRHA